MKRPVKRPKIAPLSFSELDARVSAYEKADRTDGSVASRANQILHERFSNELAQRKRAQVQRMAQAIKQSGYKG